MKRAANLLALLPVALILVFGFLALRLPGSSVAAPLLSLIPYTPEGEARRMGCDFFRAAHDLRIHRTYEVPGEVLVLFSAECPPGPGVPGGGQRRVLGIQHTRRMEGAVGMIAYEGRGGSSVVEQPAPGKPMVYGTDAGQGYVLVYGRVIEPRVAAVEAGFDIGSELRAEVRGGVFVLFARGASAACELRALDADGRTVQHVGPGDLAGFFLLAPGEAPPPNNCGH